MLISSNGMLSDAFAGQIELSEMEGSPPKINGDTEGGVLGKMKSCAAFA